MIERDRIDGIDHLDEQTARSLAERFSVACDQLVLDTCRPATPAEVAQSYSTWAKRLAVQRSRPAWLFEFHRRSQAEGRTRQR